MPTKSPRETTRRRLNIFFMFSAGGPMVCAPSFFSPESFPGPSAEQLRSLSGLDLMHTLELAHGAIPWNRPEVSEFASVTLVVELPEAMAALLQRVVE